MKRESFLRKMLCIILPLFLFSTLAVFGQTTEIKGTVTDAATGETLIGVSVSQKGTTNGTMTDLDGQYSIKVPSGATLVFTYVGYNTQEQKAAGTTINVAMSLSQQMLDEVVVVGYGVQKKSVVTAAISSVKAADLQKVTPTRIDNVLKGQVSGVQITTSSGQPGAGASVRIRGAGTVNNSEPLYIIDGMAVDGGIGSLNPADVESVEVLKDAASAAVYGSRGANGVILIITKSGKSGKAKINYEVNYGFQNPWKKKAVLNAEEYMVIRNEMTVNGGGNPMFTNEQIENARNGKSVDTNWQDEVFYKNAPVINHQLSISGGTEKLSYFVSVGYFSQDGIIGGNYDVSNYDRLSIRSNNVYEVLNAEKERSFLNKLKIGTNVSYSRVNSIYVPGGTNSEFGSVLGSAISLTPLMSVYASEADGNAILAAHPYAVKDKDGRVLQTPPDGFQEIVNPIGSMLRPSKEYNNEDKFIGSFFAELDVVKGLKFKSTYGFDLAFWGKDGYTFPYYLSERIKEENTSQTSARSDMDRAYTWQIENTLTYNLSLKDKHNFTFLAGQSARKYTGRHLGGSGKDLKMYDPFMAVINSATAAATTQRANGWQAESMMASYFGRVDYNFDERYMAQFTFRRDGSDRFGSNNKLGNFPSVSFGWNVTNEEFIKNALPSWYNYTKLRASWGTNGNQSIPNFAYKQMLAGGQNYYFGTGDDEYMIYGTSLGRILNSNLRWEESQQIDLGLDARFLNNALTFSMDYFFKKTKDMLKEMPVPGYVGLQAPYANVGKMDNWGLEFDLGYRFSVSDFNFGVKANATYMVNKLVELGSEKGFNSWGATAAAGIDNSIWERNGMPWPYFYGWKTNGILQTQEEANAYNTQFGTSAKPGDVRFKDLDGNNKIDDNDRDMIGKPTPDWTYGLTLNADWRGFDFYAFFQGVTGNDIFDISQRADIAGINRPSWILDRWTGPGTSNKIPRVTTIDENSNWRASDLYIKNGAYCRLKNIQLGYTIPLSITKKAGIERFRVYVAAENLLTFTSYKDGFDPEIGDEAKEGNRIVGVDKGVYPQSRTISFGASISF